MKIAFNPSTVAALITPPNNKDITFDLRGQNIFARGVKFCGTDTWRDIKINNVSIGSNILDLRNGSNTTLINTNGIVTINSTWRPVVDSLTSNSTTSSLSANQGRVLKALIDSKSDSGHNHDDRYLKLTGGTLTGNLVGISAMFSGRFYGDGDDEGIIIKPSSNGYAGLILGTHNGERSVFYLVKGNPFWRYNNGSTNLDIYHPKKSGTIALTTDIPSSLKNPYALTLKANGTILAVYDGSSAKEANFTYTNIGAAPASHTHSYITIPYCSSLDENSDIFRVEYAVGSNSVATKPSGVDAFGVIRLRTAAGWYGQIMMSANTAPGIYYRNANGLSSSVGWKKLLDSSNFNSYSPRLDGTGASGTWNISITGNADTIDDYHISDESRQVYKNYYTVDSPTGAWILIKFPAWNANNEIVAIDGYGGNRQAHCVVHCGSRNQGIWGYQSDYNGTVVDRIRWKGVDSGKFALVVLINEEITTLRIKATNSLEISKTTEDNAAFAISSSFFSSGGVFYGNVGIGTTFPTQRLDVVGNIRATGNSYATHFYESSDKTLKKNIKSILSSTNIPKIREFDWKDTGEHSYGFIALELEELGYGCLVNEANGKKTVNYTATLALTVAKLLNLINIQNKKISNLTKELKALKYGRKKNS